MSYNEEVWRDYVLSYDVEVSEEEVLEELVRVRADMKHRMIYAQMSGASTHLFPDMELAEQSDALMEAAVFEVKEPLVLKALAEKLTISVSPEELMQEGQAIAKRQNTSLDELKRFFGEDLSLLERDVRERKLRVWACEHKDL